MSHAGSCWICGSELDKYESMTSLRAKGYIFVKAHIIDGSVERPDIRLIICPAHTREEKKKATMEELFKD